MAKLLRNPISSGKQFIYAALAVIVVAGFCYATSNLIGYRTVALILLLTVSLAAMFFDIYPVLLAAVLSALVWNFFFIPPKFEFYIKSTEDILMFLMYFVIALLNAVLTSTIRKREKVVQRKEEKENTLKLYSTLLNSLSHELRTPISTIIAATDNLQSGSGKLSPDNKKDLIQEIYKASLRLNAQVENLLNMSRLESGMLQLKKDWCDVNEMVYDTLSHLKEEAAKHRVIVEIKDHLPLFRVDYGLIQHTLYNLLNNAFQYTPENSAISIRVDFDHHESGHFEDTGEEQPELIRDRIVDALKIIIEDEGPGFPPEELYNVFDKFYRLKQARTGGTGLGLSIVKGFIEAHDGLVILENKPGGGARFTLLIPAEASYLNNLKNE